SLGDSSGAWHGRRGRYSAAAYRRVGSATRAREFSMIPGNGVPVPARKTVSLRCGTLHLEIERADMDLEELCGYASRRSRKRGFVFVSKVLGKHYPVRPRKMAEVHARLAERLDDLPGPVVVIALAETATGLGHGLYESWLRLNGRVDSLFLQTTRY